MNGSNQAVTVRRVPGGLVAAPSAYRSAVSVDAQLYAELLDYFRYELLEREIVEECDASDPFAPGHRLDRHLSSRQGLLDRLVLRGRLSGVYL